MLRTTLSRNRRIFLTTARGVAVIEGYVEDHQGMLIAALARGLDARTFLEIGTNRGRTSWTVARDNPDLHVYTLDVPLSASSADVALELGSDDHHFFRPGEACGEAFRDTPEGRNASRSCGATRRRLTSPGTRAPSTSSTSTAATATTTSRATPRTRSRCSV